MSRAGPGRGPRAVVRLLVLTGALLAIILVPFVAVGGEVDSWASGELSDSTALWTGLFDRFGVAVLVICRPIPVLAEASVLAAGAARMPPRRCM